MKKVHELDNGYKVESDWKEPNIHFDVKVLAPTGEAKNLKVLVPFDAIFGYDPTNRDDVLFVAKQIIKEWK